MPVLAKVVDGVFLMRSAFNTTADLFYGPGTASPGVLKGSCAARLVMVDGIFLVGNGGPFRVAWLTLNSLVPVGPWSHPNFFFDPTLADQIAVPSGSPVRWWNLFTDNVIWHGHTPYYRANLSPLPIPTVSPPPPPIVYGGALLKFGGVGSPLVGGEALLKFNAP